MILLKFPLHPALVHFPIALFISAIFFEILSLIFKKIDLHKTAWHIYIFAVLFTPLAVLSGLKEADRLDLHHPVLTLHKNFALLSLGAGIFSFLVCLLLKKKFPPHFRPIFLIFLIVIVVAIVCTAYNGGRLVYDYGAGSEP